MKQVSFNYLDLDELLAYFSIKESESNIVVDILT